MEGRFQNLVADIVAVDKRERIEVDVVDNRLAGQVNYIDEGRARGCDDCADLRAGFIGHREVCIKEIVLGGR